MKNRLHLFYVAAACLALQLCNCRLQTPQEYAPSVKTLGADTISQAGARLEGSVNPNGSPSSGWFEWGTDPGLSAPAVATIHQSLGNGTADSIYSAMLTGLTPGTTYYFRAIGANHAGQNTGKLGTFTTLPNNPVTITVNSLQDTADPPEGEITIRAALAAAQSGDTILFSPDLDGGVINLQQIGSGTTELKAEVYDLNMAEMRWDYLGFQLRKYGNSALYARKNVSLDASALPEGITLNWAGGEESHARVLAVFGNLTMKNINITSGFAQSVALDNETQPYTLARGGGIAVWGTAILEKCRIYGNTAQGDTTPSRDRGSFGGGIYADILTLTDCVVSGNTVSGFGAAGGGVYSVGGADGWGQGSMLTRSTLSGNRVTGQHAYGGGVYSDGGGPGSSTTLRLVNCTIARNAVEDHPGLPENAMYQYYYRGGGVYMSNGSLSVTACTIAENEVTGSAHEFSAKPNMGGGGIAATIGNAHVVESMQLKHSIVAGNTVSGLPDDIFTGSLVHFYSWGYNRVGRLDFSHILAPVPPWNSLSRKHWPKAGDSEAMAPANALDLASAAYDPVIISAGADSGAKALLWYPPGSSSKDLVPAVPYRVSYCIAEYALDSGATDDFLNQVLKKIRLEHGDTLGEDFGESFGDLTGISWYGPSVEWPANPQNEQWIGFWHDLDTAIGDRLGAEKLGDNFWATFKSGRLGSSISLHVEMRSAGPFRMSPIDQRGSSRPVELRADSGAIEQE